MYMRVSLSWKRTGEKKEFTLDNYPDSTWTFVDTRTILKEKGYEPSIHDFSMMDMSTGDDITDRRVDGYGIYLPAGGTSY